MFSVLASACCKQLPFKIVNICILEIHYASAIKNYQPTLQSCAKNIHKCSIRPSSQPLTHIPATESPS